MNQLEALQGLTIAAVLLAFCALVISARRTSVRGAVEPLKRRVATLETELLVMQEQVNSVLEAWRRTNARIGMAQARAARKESAQVVGPDGLPDPNRDPERWRAAIRARAERRK